MRSRGFIVLSCGLLACGPNPAPPMQWSQLGPIDAPAWAEATAVEVTLNGQNDTLLYWEQPLASWVQAGIVLREGDAGTIRLEQQAWQVAVTKIWTSQDWEREAFDRVGEGAFDERLWLAGALGPSAPRLSRGSHCRCLAVDTAQAEPVAVGEYIAVSWSQHGQGEMANDRRLNLLVRWGDDDQLIPPFWRAVERWGAPATWELVCPSDEAFGMDGIPLLGIRPHTPVHFSAQIERRPDLSNQE